MHDGLRNRDTNLDGFLDSPRLIQRLLEEQAFQPRHSTCALSKKSCRFCYSQPGVFFTTKGSYAHAKICPCVQTCQNCHGSAMRIDRNKEAVACHPDNPKMIVNLYNNAKIPRRYANANLNEIVAGESLRSVTAKLQAWLTSMVNFKAESAHDPKSSTLPMGFIITGDIGSGKTYLLSATVKRLILSGFSVKFIDFYQLITEIKAKYSQGQSVDDLLKPLLQVDILAIDELGKGRKTEFEHTVIDQLVMSRYNAQKIIIAATNSRIERAKTHNEFEKQNNFQTFAPLEEAIGARIYSRLMESCYTWILTGKDLRLKTR